MDKIREVKRGGSRLSPAKRQQKAPGHKIISALNGGYLEFSNKSKKEKIGEMHGGSEGEEEYRMPGINGSKRFKFGKVLDECNGVDPATVPRKLRSAMNKRNPESISPPCPDAKKQHISSNGSESPDQVNGAKKYKQSTKQGALERCQQVLAVSKDEEEVAETLFALATMIPKDKPNKSRVEGTTTEAKPSSSPERKTSPVPPSETPKEDMVKLDDPVSTGTEPTNLLCTDEILEESVKIESEAVPANSEQPTISGSQKFDLELASSSQADVTRTSLLSKDEYKYTMQLTSAVNLLNSVEVSPEAYSANGLLQATQSAVFPLPKSENGSWLAVAAASKQEMQPIKENKEQNMNHISLEDGVPQLLCGLLPGSCDSSGQYTRSSSAKAAVTWSDSVTCATRPRSTTNGFPTEKLQPVSVERRLSWKRCASHVHISRLISSYKSAERKGRSPLNQLELNGGAKSCETSAERLNGLKTGPDSIASSGINGLAVEKNQNEARIGNVYNDRLLQDQQGPTSSKIHAKLKQGYDFLSLSASCESNNHDKGLESSAQLQVPYLPSLLQHHPSMPFSVAHGHYSSPYPDQLAAAAAAAAQQVQLQLPHYMQNPFYGPQPGHVGSSKPLQQQHQQQQMWAAQVARCRSGGASSHPQKWQNGRLDPPSIFPTSPPALEALGTKYSPNVQQLAMLSSSSSRGRRSHHPGGYDEAAGLRSDGSPHMQLLCNAQYM